jgi:hypothetical protein
VDIPFQFLLQFENILLMCKPFAIKRFLENQGDTAARQDRSVPFDTTGTGKKAGNGTIRGKMCRNNQFCGFAGTL